MKFEKITDNKIKICFDKCDLAENKISIHKFMSNSIENQDIFLKILNEANSQIGFNTANSQVFVEALTRK